MQTSFAYARRMNQYDLVSAIQCLQQELDTSLLSDKQCAVRIYTLIKQIEAASIMDDRLKHDLMMVESLLILKRRQQALDRLRSAVVATYLRA
ncbi:hypothetical protein [Caballeronia sp. ATUFL_F2_KS9A]|uniref:hypothetical protein n=1 Tax=Caballeronia sp. ATUFL_F2_KS9A TaxID=2921777 RepID=UPI002029712B|nr:hypothetical protein [Caballeronia sp. ATUFL_F2_KS9A]